MEQSLIEAPCEHIALRRDGSIRFTRTRPKRPAWMVVLWQGGHLTGWVQDGPSTDSAGLTSMVGEVWRQRLEDWPLRYPRKLTVDSETLQRMPNLPYMLGADSNFEVIGADGLLDQAGEQIASFESFWVEVSNMLRVWDVHNLMADDTADLATEVGFLIPFGPTLWDTLRRENSVQDLAREIAMGRRG